LGPDQNKVGRPPEAAACEEGLERIAKERSRGRQPWGQVLEGAG